MNRDGQKGSTLFMITCICGVLGFLATYLFYRSEVEWALVSQQQQIARCRTMGWEILRSELALFAGDDSPADSPEDSWYHGGRTDMERDGFRISALIEDEGAKLNLNTLDQKDLSLLTSGQSGTEISFDSLLDWRDGDDEPRPSGAELDYYQDLAKGYRTRNGFFSTVEELNQVKGGTALYKMLADQVTVYGRLNPNAIRPETFGELLKTLGFTSFDADRMAGDFKQYRATEDQNHQLQRFSNIDDFLKLSSILIPTRDRLRPFFRFSGGSNLNFMTRGAMAALLNQAGLQPELAAGLAARVKQQPFASQNEIDNYFLDQNQHFISSDYFSCVTTMVRYRVWVSKGKVRYYIDTVQERTRANVMAAWQVRPLAWYERSGSTAGNDPELPEPPPPPAAETKKNGGSRDGI